MSDINCALGLSQLKKLNQFIKKRRQIVNLYHKYLNGIKGIKIINFDNLDFSSWHLLIMLLDFKKLKFNRDNFIKYLNKNNIFPQIHYIPLYKFSYYKFLKKKHFPNAEKFYKSCLSFPLHTKLTGKDVKVICNYIKKYLNKYEKKNY